MSKAIKLGHEAPDYGSELTAPANPVEGKDMPKKTVYPSIYISDAPPELGEIPDEGTAVVKYKVVERGMSDRDGKKSARCDIEIHSFKPTSGAGKAMGEGKSDADDAVDSYFEKSDAQES